MNRGAGTAASSGARPLARLIVTRPAPQAQAWAQALREHGWPAYALPLIAIGEPTTPEERDGLWHWRRHWPQADAILFVSGAAVQHFFAGDVARPDWPARTRFWAPGPGTARLLAQALAERGLDADRIDAPADTAAQFDSEHLWPRVASQVGPGRRVLIVRGRSRSAAPASGAVALPGSGRDWLARQCLAVGARVEACVAYARHWPTLSAAEQALARAAAGPGGVWLFSSSEALPPLRAIAPDADWSRADALATHSRIAAAAREWGFGHVVSTRPAFADVLRTLESAGYRP